MLASYQKALFFISLTSLVITTLFIAPSLAYDPFNVSRLLSLGSFAGASIVALLLGLKHKWISQYRTPLFAVLFFIASLTLTILITAPRFMAQFYGAYGRNTGYLAYFSLAILLLVAVIVSNFHNLS